MTEEKFMIELCDTDPTEEIAWRALMAQPKDVYMEWLDGYFDDVKELINLFDSLNDKLNRRISVEMADMYRDDFMEKLKIDKLI